MHSERDDEWMNALNAQALIWRCFGLYRLTGQLDSDLKALWIGIRANPELEAEADGVRAGGEAVSEIQKLVLSLMVTGRDRVVSNLGGCTCPRCTELRTVIVHCLDAIQGAPPCRVPPPMPEPRLEADPEPAAGFDHDLADQLLRQVFGDGAA